MDGLVISGLVVFVGAVAAIYFTRKKLTTTGRVLLWVAAIAVLLVTIMRADRLREKEEVVWHPKAVDWSGGPLPIRIYWSELSFPDYNRAISDAVKVWNDRVSANGGCPILARVPDRGHAQIVLRPYDGGECGKETIGDGKINEHEKHPAFGNYCNGYVDIQLMKLASTGEAFRIVLHEVGHAIGLDHDTDQIGAMNPKVAEPQAGDFPEYLLPSNKDVVEIRRKYCRGPVDADP